MNCAQARFLLYAYLDRDISGVEAEGLSRHLLECPPCSDRARSARGLAFVLKSRVTRSQAPIRLRQRLREGENAARRFRYPLLATAAVVLFLLVPLVADVTPRSAISASPALAAGSSPALAAGVALAAGSIVPASVRAAPSQAGSDLVTRHMTGTLVCIECESRLEAGLCPVPEARHQAAFCAENGEVWRLMSHDPAFTQRSAGQTVTVDGVGFPQSGFLRASRVGY